jgi:hypothetical protein
MGWVWAGREKQRIHTEFLWRTSWEVVLCNVHARLSLIMVQPHRNIQEKYETYVWSS